LAIARQEAEIEHAGVFNGGISESPSGYGLVAAEEDDVQGIQGNMS
jgi:hypothetical protein